MFTQISLPITGFILLVSNWCTSSTHAMQEDNNAQWSDSVVQTEREGPGILIIPMDGQMHTDIRAEVYEGLVDRIKEADPDLIVVELLSRDRLNNFAYLMDYGDRNEFNPFDPEDLINIANVFYIELKEYPQVAWVKDSSGASTVLALSWPTLYMSSGAFLRSTKQVSDFNNIDAEDTRGKIREFRTIHGKIVADYGRRSYALVRAFIDPDVPLSGTWKGKEVIWEENIFGDFVVDIGEDQMPQFTATQATEVGISEGLVKSTNDVLLAQGIREYHLVGEDITDDINQSVVDWRNNFAKALKLWADAQQYSQWAESDEGNQVKRDVTDEMRSLQQLLKIMQKSTPIAKRLARPYRPGITIQYVKDRIQMLEERLDNIRDGGKGGGRGGGGGGGGRGGGRS